MSGNQKIIYMTNNDVWVNAVGLVYRDTRPKKPDNPKDKKATKLYATQMIAWNEKVDEAINLLCKKVTWFNVDEFRSRTLMEKDK